MNMNFTAPALKTLAERGFLHQCTDAEGLDALFKQETVTVYIGFDCTAKSLHVGSLMQIMALRHLQKHGHKPVVLLGGGTTKLGDPSFRDEARKLLSEDEIAENMAGIRKVFGTYLTFGDGPTDATMVNNAEWLDGINYMTFLRDYGRHFSVNRMLSFDSVRLRLEREQSLSFLEFNYMILQAYDFVELHGRYNCRVQMGGSDQWGNIVNGVELNRRLAKKEIFGLTTPLLTTSSGAKMGKTAKGAVWLDAEMLTAYDFWQYWRNTEDGDVGRFLRLFTELPMVEIARLEALEGSAINDAKIILANEVTALCHGRAAAEQAAETARKTFAEGGVGDNLPQVTVSKAALEEGIRFVELLVQAGLSASNGEAKRAIRGGGAKLNGQPVSDEAALVRLSDCNEEGIVKISASKKAHAIIRTE